MTRAKQNARGEQIRIKTAFYIYTLCRTFVLYGRLTGIHTFCLPILFSRVQGVDNCDQRGYVVRVEIILSTFFALFSLSYLILEKSERQKKRELSRYVRMLYRLCLCMVI